MKEREHCALLPGKQISIYSLNESSTFSKYKPVCSRPSKNNIHNDDALNYDWNLSMSDNSQNALLFMYMITRFRVHKGIFFFKKQDHGYVWGFKKTEKGKHKYGWYALKKKKGGGSQKSQLCKHVSIRNASKFVIWNNENQKMKRARKIKKEEWERDFPWTNTYMLHSMQPNLPPLFLSISLSLSTRE